jgi:lysyl-tRNA synthetase class 2
MISITRNAQDKNKKLAFSPSATWEDLRKRARIIQTIRQFFISREVLEVDTPLLCYTSVTDPFIESIPATYQTSHAKPLKYYLQTSPEYAMKRMLAAGSGPIFQICKAFRQGEVGRMHNPEFTMLEWYRPGFNHHELMNEMDVLLQLILDVPTAVRKTYAALFQAFLNIDPHQVSISELRTCAQQNNINVDTDISDRDTWLNLLMSHIIEPHLGKDRPYFIYDFPASQAALARIQPGNPPLASRFEVYYKGMELANGFHELLDANEQYKRFQANLAMREARGLTAMPIDEFFIAALEHGLPDCAGVALGIDRLVMLALQKECIADILSFDFNRV